jgi:hypothetical protein
VRTTVVLGLSTVLTVSGPASAAAQNDVTAVRARTFDQLWAVVKPYGSSLHYRVYRMPKDPFTIQAFYERDLHYTPRFEIYISVTRQQTIQFRIYPQLLGGYLNLDSLSNEDSLMERVLRFSDKGFFFWAANENRDVFAGYTFTLESGFPEEAIKEVLRSIPLLDSSVGQLTAFME